MAATLGIFRQSRPLLCEFAAKNRYDDDSLREGVAGNRYRLVDAPSSRGTGLQIETLVKFHDSQHSDAQPRSRRTAAKPTQPTALKPLSGCVFVPTLVAGIAVLSYLRRQEQLLGGW